MFGQILIIDSLITVLTYYENLMENLIFSPKGSSSVPQLYEIAKK